MAFLTKQEILSASAIAEQVVLVPEWGGEVLVRGLTGKQRDAFEKSLIVGKGKSREVNIENARAKLLAFCIIDPETKKPLFSHGEIEALGNKSGKALNRVYDVATELSGIGEEEIEELTKNSEGTPEDTSISA
jgi:hypothetical protein